MSESSSGNAIREENEDIYFVKKKKILFKKELLLVNEKILKDVESFL